MARRDKPGPCARPRGGAPCGCALAALVIGLVGCGSGGHNADAGVDAVLVEWWQPKLGEAKNWDIQLSTASGAVDVSAPRVMYDLDLWSLVPSPMTLDYGGGKTVAVPAGAHAGMIAQLHARTPQTIVICHVETGALEMSRPDARLFPAAAIGGDVPVPAGSPAAKFLDTSEAGRVGWASIMWKRFDLAKQIGCDGIEPAHNDVSRYTGTGFTIRTEDTLSWYAEVARQGHDRKLSTGMKNGDPFTDKEVDNFDWLMIERCGELGCEAVRVFTDANKDVFAIDYDHDSDGLAQGSANVCAAQMAARIQDGLYKDVSLTKMVRTQCNP